MSAALCRVCLRGAPDVRLVRSASARTFFTDVVRLVDIPDRVVLCGWCASSVREALALVENAVHADPLLRWIHCALRDGHTIDENLISNARSLQKPLHSFACTDTEHTEIAGDITFEDELKGNLSETILLSVESKQDNDHISHVNDYPLTSEKSFENEPTEMEIKKELEEKENIDVHPNDSFDVSNVARPSRKQKKRHRNQKKINVKTNLEFKQKKRVYQDDHFEVIHLSFEEQLQEIRDNMRSEKYLRSRFHCERCGLGFLTESVHASHMERHEKRFGPFKCAVCTLRFTTGEVLQQHALAHRRHFRCVACAALIRRRCHCAAHRARCAGGEAVECARCRKSFGDIHTLKQHINGVHLKEKSLVCNFCNKRFSHKQKLLVHLRCHTGERPFKCDTCGKSFSTNSNLKAHASTHDAGQPRHYCVECDAYFKTTKGLKRHFDESAKHYNKDSLHHACEQCPMRFLNEKRLSAHVSYVHLGRSDNHCSACGKGFRSSGNLRKHIQSVHEKVKRPKDKMCDICGRGFALRRTLELHMHTHTGARPHACDHCTSTFAQPSAKRAHMRAAHPDGGGANMTAVCVAGIVQ